MNNLRLEDFLYKLVSPIEGLKFLDSKTEVHHVDGNRKNNTLKNLQTLSKKEHAKIHMIESGGLNKYQQGPRIQTIKSISYVGKEPTYDIKMKDPYRNFVANGVIVHNCGKSLISKTISSEWKLPLLRLDVGKVMQGLIGSSEQNMRQAIAQAESCSPAVLWLDEIEKSLSGTKSSNHSDGGTLARVFGTLLTAMEEGMKGVVLIATANDIQALPPELIRRFDEVFFIDLPTPEEREEIFTIHFRKKGRDVKKLKLNMEKIIKASHKFTGSEIEKVVKESIARAYHSKKKDVTTKDVIGAIEDTRVIAVVMKEQIDKIRDWAKDRARYASSLAEKAAAPGKQKVHTNKGEELDVSESLDGLDEIKLDSDPAPEIDKKEEEVKIGMIDPSMLED